MDWAINPEVPTGRTCHDHGLSPAVDSSPILTEQSIITAPEYLLIGRGHHSTLPYIWDDIVGRSHRNNTASYRGELFASSSRTRNTTATHVAHPTTLIVYRQHTSFVVMWAEIAVLAAAAVCCFAARRGAPEPTPAPAPASSPPAPSNAAAVSSREREEWPSLPRPSATPSTVARAFRSQSPAPTSIQHPKAFAIRTGTVTKSEPQPQAPAPRPTTRGSSRVSNPPAHTEREKLILRRVEHLAGPRDAEGEWVLLKLYTRYKGFGFYLCPHCSRTWMSSKSSKRFRQGCQGCETMSFPAAMWVNTPGHYRPPSSRIDTLKPHDSSRCEACAAGQCEHVVVLHKNDYYD